MRHLANTTYLLGQMSRLAQIESFELYRQGSSKQTPLDREVWKILSPWSGQWKRCSDISFIKNLLKRLDGALIDALVYHFSTFHGNGVHAIIAQHENWVIREFPLELMQVQYMEPEFQSIIKRLDHWLLKVAVDKYVVDHPRFRVTIADGAEPYNIFLGKWKRPGAVRLVDGNHRAIRLTQRWITYGGSVPKLSVVVPDLPKKFTS